jgi:hypothetical protein
MMFRGVKLESAYFKRFTVGGQKARLGPSVISPEYDLVRMDPSKHIFWHLNLKIKYGKIK